MKAFDVFTFVVLLRFSTMVSGERDTMAPDDFTVIPVPLESPQNVSDKEKKALRYGFHRTQECNSFEKSFLCITRCLELDFDVAYADKYCICTCYKNRDKAKYKIPGAGPTKWRLEYPSTKLPPWPRPDAAKLVAIVSDFSSEMRTDGEIVAGKHISNERDAHNADKIDNQTTKVNEPGVTEKDSKEANNAPGVTDKDVNTTSGVTNKDSKDAGNASGGAAIDSNVDSKSSGVTATNPGDTVKPDSNQT